MQTENFVIGNTSFTENLQQVRHFIYFTYICIMVRGHPCLRHACFNTVQRCILNSVFQFFLFISNDVYASFHSFFKTFPWYQEINSLDHYLSITTRAIAFYLTTCTTTVYAHTSVCSCVLHEQKYQFPYCLLFLSYLHVQIFNQQKWKMKESIWFPLTLFSLVPPHTFRPTLFLFLQKTNSF